MEPYDYYELIDEFGQEYFRWDTNLGTMERYQDGKWHSHGWSPRSLRDYADSWDDATLTVVTADDVR